MKRIFLIYIFLFLINYCFGQNNKYTISGYVQEEISGENLIGVSVYDKATYKGSTTNQYGFYSLTLPEGEYDVVYSFIGLKSITKRIELNKDLRINASLKEDVIVTEEVQVTGERQDKNVESSEMGQIRVNVEKIKKIPVILGEIDVLKTAQLLPGIQSGGEGSAGLYVRGGGPDQNLILLDEATVYNANHLFGFFSVFNADAIKDINIIKGGMPAKYGGRLSSVLDISMKEGNNKKYETEGGIGLISSKLTFQGPIKKNKSSFIISGRRTYIDILASPFLNKPGNAFAGSGYYFYDLTTKVNYKISDKDRIFLSGYFGRDVFNFVNTNNNIKIKIPWGNATTAFRWNHLFSDKLFVNTSLIFTDYRFAFDIEQRAIEGGTFQLNIFSGINDWNTKVDFLYQPNPKHTVRFGTNFIYHRFTPGNATGRVGDVDFSPDNIFRQYSNEGALYLSDDIIISDVLKVHAGIRYSSFQHSGDIRVRNYLLNELTLNNDNYRHIEPRLSARYFINPTSSIKAAYTENYQYIHLANTSSVSLPTDLWVPSSSKIEPKHSKQYALGYFKNLKNNDYEVSIEGYYKEMTNLIEYKEGILPEDNSNTSSDDSFHFGTGDSYGVELLIQKNKGKTTGWLGYTWSKTTRYFDSINNGFSFPAKYDRRHDLSLVTTYELSKKWTLSGVFVYSTGNTATLPEQRYVIDGDVYTEYTERNGYRMDAYHRLDLAATYHKERKKKKIIVLPDGSEEITEKKARLQTSWTFSIYNVYSRQNPYFIYFALEDVTAQGNGSIEDGGLVPKAYQVSIFPIIPSVTWNFKF
ncbi:MAG: TonB-dependent receptor [Bacteroidota bacterium]|nr:TonB-dependent receptor [Bacteroidota bacterium]